MKTQQIPSTSRFLILTNYNIPGNGSCTTDSWAGLLFCTDRGRHELGNCLLMLHGIGNNLILLRSQTRVARIVIVYYWTVARRRFTFSFRRPRQYETQPLLSSGLWINPYHWDGIREREVWYPAQTQMTDNIEKDLWFLDYEHCSKGFHLVEGLTGIFCSISDNHGT